MADCIAPVLVSCLSVLPIYTCQSSHFKFLCCLHPPQYLVMLHSDTLAPLDSQLPILQLVYLGISPVSSVTRWIPRAQPSYCIWVWSNLMSLLSPTGAQFNCLQLRLYVIPSSNLWPIFFRSLGKELIAFSLSTFQASNRDHFSVWNRSFTFILQNFMFFKKRCKAN
jgi:hypothetical protein